jgi:hypothetical protein
LQSFLERKFFLNLVFKALKNDHIYATDIIYLSGHILLAAKVVSCADSSKKKTTIKYHLFRRFAPKAIILQGIFWNRSILNVETCHNMLPKLKVRDFRSAMLT